MFLATCFACPSFMRRMLRLRSALEGMLASSSCCHVRPTGRTMRRPNSSFERHLAGGLRSWGGQSATPLKDIPQARRPNILSRLVLATLRALALPARCRSGLAERAWAMSRSGGSTPMMAVVWRGFVPIEERPHVGVFGCWGDVGGGDANCFWAVAVPRAPPIPRAPAILWAARWRRAAPWAAGNPWVVPTSPGCLPTQSPYFAQKKFTHGGF